MIYQKMRPHRFDDMVGQEWIVDNIQNQSKRNIWFNAYIFGGQFGSGKTTMAWIIALAANCNHKDENGNPCLDCDSCSSILNGCLDFKEIDGASTTGVDNIRELKEWMDYKPIMNKKVVIIDEVHMLSTNAFNSLLKILEEPPSYAIFILCTTEVDSIPLTVQSRSACYSFGRIPETMIEEHIKKVAILNQIAIDDTAACVMAKYSSGSLRNALKLLEQLSASGEVITEQLCRDIIGISNEDSVFGLLDAMLNQSLPVVVAQLSKLEKKGKNLAVLADDLLIGCSDLIIASCSGINEIGGTEQYRRHVDELVTKYQQKRFCELSEQIALLRQAIKIDSSKNQFIIQTVALIQHMKADTSALTARIDELEKKISNIHIQAVQDHSLKEVSTDEHLCHVEENVSEQFDIEEESLIAGSGTEYIEQEELPSAKESVVNDTSLIKEEPDQEEEDMFDENWLDKGIESHEFHELFENEYNNRQQESNSHELIPEQTAVKPVNEDNNCARKAEEHLDTICSNNPEIASHVMVGCKRVYKEDGLLLVTPEPSVCNLLLLYFGREQVKNIFVNCDPSLVL
jgi:DNA polymerase-3 subunit gamma/tau